MTTIHEVAKAAGVSISTVSYALSGKRPVSEKTRLRIEHAARSLGYEPDAGARMLAGRRTHIFALTEPLRADTHAPTHMAFVLATAVAARRRGYDILLLTDEQASEGMNRVAASNLVDAILVLDVAPDDERVAIARAVRTPTVFIGVPDDQTDLTCVDLDFDAAGHLAVDALADAGHTRITLLGQTEVSYRKSNFPRRLLHGAQERAAERGVTLQMATTGTATTDTGAVRAAAEAALARGDRAFIVHAANDVHETLLAILGEQDLRVGEDVSVVSAAASFDTSSLPVPVDTIPLIPQQSCELAVDLAVRHLEESNVSPRIHLIPPEYHAVGSVAPPRH
ncbi:MULTISPECIES: LacI family DNA-binding transcriptional regulator [unclassified Microbacterium]|uniref:LacI family DNA-binding transcriptional regulator n=1 Tax=unclassified Microbacterium TaxID=2609290 RepID=UPI000EA85489|nr:MULTISPECIES: LacI family DNA-binding transcriptional regulator [unclassified Microbacterium]MBT2485140.1 LacI family DNA-binding transcriptional regulator [Microbacterium sp. ISL-108]RKN67978.1 LacI family transcriptional regulator [Microbacterium sp. CGR2]